MTIDIYRRLFVYDAWGNRTTLDSLRMSTQAPASRACAITAHLVGSGTLWLDRLYGRASTSEVWPALSLDQCEVGFRSLEGDWNKYLDGLKEKDLERPITYINTKGESWKSTIRDILMHVVLHGTYHRGQIAMLVRQSGHAPAYTDFIEATRRGLVT